ncbi:MAG TPA: prolyl oligopeptidase family serine peptidase [Longimicrobium sp.]
MLRRAALLAFALAACGGRGASAARTAEALRSLASAPPVPLGTTPDGRRLLMKSAENAAFTLAVLDRATGATVARRSLGDPPLAATLRPDGDAVAFLMDRGGDQEYVPTVMEVRPGTSRPLGAPATSIPGPLLWSPDGNRLAYLQAGRRSASRRLVVAEASGSWQALLPDVEPRTGFAWSPDGRGLAAVRKESGGVVSVVSLDGSAREYTVARGAEIHELAWIGEGRMLATVREAGRQFFSVVDIELGTGSVQRLASGSWDAAELQPLSGGAWAFHANVDSELAPVVCGGGAAACRRLSLPPGSARILGSVRGTDTILVSHRGRITPARVLPVVPDRGDLAPRTGPAGAPPQAERIDLRAADGLAVPAYAWRALRPRAGARAVVIRVHGGPAVQAERGWDRTTEYLLRSGIDVVQLNYRGSTGYGASFERAPGGDCARVRDVLAAVAAAEREMGVPRERIVLYGHSYGALLVGKAAREMREPVGAVVVVSVVAGNEEFAPGCSQRSGGAWVPSRLRAYHGANDHGLSPHEARRRIAGLFGWGPFQRLRARWRVFEHEGHTFHRNESWARVYADIIDDLDGTS